MRRPASIIFGIALLACAGGAASAGTAKGHHKEVVAARPTGKPVSCIPLHSIRETRVRDDRTIDFIMNAGRNKAYRNTLPHSCPQLGFEERFLYKTSLSQLCSTDIITVLTSSGPGLSRGASCGLGEFQPVELAKKPGK
jgi:hypothetical protein